VLHRYHARGRRGGRVKEGIEGGVDHWLVGPGEEVGSGSAWHGGVRGEAAALC
jgi:hypothetical protein